MKEFFEGFSHVFQVFIESAFSGNRYPHDLQDLGELAAAGLVGGVSAILLTLVVFSPFLIYNRVTKGKKGV